MIKTERQNNQEKGRIFEKEIHEILIKTRHIILREKDIVRKYGRNNYGIDHILYTDEYIINIQDKIENSKPTLTKINHFIKCVDNISDIERKKCYGIYLSKNELTKGSIKAFEFENIKNKNNFISIYDNDIEEIKKKLLELLYKNGICLYDDDGSTIMLSSQ